MDWLRLSVSGIRKSERESRFGKDINLLQSSDVDSIGQNSATARIALPGKMMLGWVGEVYRKHY
jgi:hypothetical protein